MCQSNPIILGLFYYMEKSVYKGIPIQVKNAVGEIYTITGKVGKQARDRAITGVSVVNLFND